MIKQKNRWTIQRRGTREEAARLAETLGVGEITARLLLNRRLKEPAEAKRFLTPSLEGLRDPYAMKDMDRAVKQIRKAMAAGGKICVFGDYDVDGVTASAILLSYFRHRGYDNLMHHLPDRRREGYGLSKAAVEMISGQGCELLITVDCGITSLEEVDLANRLGVAVVVTDHHKPGGRLPDAAAVVNPKQEACGFGFRELAGAGIAFKLVQALSRPGEDLRPYLGLSALGTVADVVPLVDENRIIVKSGLKVLNETPSTGLEALISAAGLSGKRIEAGHVAFALAPRINAAGRLSKAEKALALLMCEDGDEAGALAEELDLLNRKRQAVERQIHEEAEAMIERRRPERSKILVLAKEGWDSGVIGIVASKLVESHHRPVVMIALEDGIGKASARSFGKIDLYALLEKGRSFYLKFGGHRQAAGFSIEADRVEAYRRHMEALADETISDSQLVETLSIDCELDPARIDFGLVADIGRLEPFGFGNPKPRFLIRRMRLDKHRYVGKSGSHLKATFNENRRMFDAIGFQMEAYKPVVKKDRLFDLVFTLDRNVFRNVESIQFMLKDLRVRTRDYYVQDPWGTAYLEAFLRRIGKASLLTGGDGSDRSGSEKREVRSWLGMPGVVVAVYTLEGLFGLLAEMEDAPTYEGDPLTDVFFGPERPEDGRFHVAVLPTGQELGERGCHRIVNYDGFGMGPESTAADFSEPEDLENMRALVRDLLPQRSHLAAVYRHLKKGDGTGKSVEGVSRMKLKAALEILEDSRLIEWSEGGYVLSQVPDEKVDIMNNRVYRRLDEILQAQA